MIKFELKIHVNRVQRWTCSYNLLLQFHEINIENFLIYILHKSQFVKTKAMLYQNENEYTLQVKI